jgi:hypothetical protein
MADGGGARPESERGRGFRWPEAVVQAQGAVGKDVALERGGVRRGVGDGGAVGHLTRFERPVGDVAEREKGRERGGRPWECYVVWGCRGAWPRPAGSTRQRPEHGARG